MLLKTRSESTELLILKSLNIRMNLADKEKRHYFNLKKGYEGEILFDSLTDKLQFECFILNDLLLKLNNTMFQIDSLIITQETIYFYEVKNYEGDYFYESDRIYKKSKSEINNPLNQLIRSESLVRQLLQSLGCNLPVEASVIFINPEFTLYQTPLNKPFIFPTQVKRYLKNLDTTPSKLDRKHKLLAEKLISLDIKDSPFTLLPLYDYDRLEKGLTCAKCSSLQISIDGSKCLCKKCGYEELIETAVMRSVQEVRLLFPDLKITTNLIFDWCKMIMSKKRIRKILGENLIKSGSRQWTYFV